MKKRNNTSLTHIKDVHWSGKIDKGSVFIVAILIFLAFGAFVFTGGVLPARHPEDDPNIIVVPNEEEATAAPTTPTPPLTPGSPLQLPGGTAPTP